MVAKPFYFIMIVIMWNYKIKAVSPKRDSNGKLFSYSVVVVSKANPDYTTSFAYTPEDFEKLFWIKNPDQAMALVWQSCSVLKSSGV